VFNKKLRYSPARSNRRTTHALALFIFLSSLSGCAHKQFGPAVTGDEFIQLEQMYTAYRNSFSSCTTGLDGDVLVHWRPAVNRTSFTGYVKILLPTYLQVSALTPLNQPLFALSSDGKWFQTIDIAKKTFRKGSLRSFSARHDIPKTLLAGEWGAWLTGRPLVSAPYVTGIIEDLENRGVWISISDRLDKESPIEHTLVNFSSQRIAERVVVNARGDTDAVISYGDWQTVGGCPQPMKIIISELPFGTGAVIELSDIQPANLKKDDFNLYIPSGYRRQFLP